MKIFFAALLALMLTSHSIAEECSRQQAIDAEIQVDTIKTWDELRGHFLLYGQCDDGSIAEGYSESISYLMEHRWTEFLRLELDANFSKFIQKHIDELWEINRYNRVASFAKNNCNKSKESICQTIISSGNNVE